MKLSVLASRLFKALLVIIMLISSPAALAYQAKVLLFIAHPSDAFNKEFVEAARNLSQNLNITLEVITDKDENVIKKEMSKRWSLDCGVIVLATSKSLMEYALEKARKLDTQVVFYKVRPDDDLLESFHKAWFVGEHPQKSAQVQAHMISSYFKEVRKFNDNFLKSNSINFVMLRGDDEDAHIRTEHVWKNLLGEGLVLNPLCDFDDHWLFEEAEKDMHRSISRYGLGGIDLVIANNDEMALGAVDALNQYGYNLGDGNMDRYIPVFGIDGSIAALSSIKKRKLTGTAFVDRVTEARVALILAASDSITESQAESLTRKKVFSPRKIFIPYSAVTFY